MLYSGGERKGAESIRAYNRGFLIYNPNAGKLRTRGEAFVWEMVGALRGKGHRVEPWATEKAGDGTTLARAAVERGADLVLAAGGDGTLNEVVNGLAGTEVPLGLIPAGTANVCAHEIGIGNDPFAALRGFEGWVERRVALGYVEPAGAEARYFLLMAGLGFDAGTVRAVRPVWKRAVGKLAYYLAGIENLVRAPLEPILAESEWGRHEGTFLLASRVRNYGGDFNIATEAHLLREDLELVNFTAREPAAYLAYLGAVALRRVAGFPGIEIRHLTRLEAQAANGRPVRIQVDGELHGELPARITVKREALTLLVPEGYPNG